MEKMKDRKNLTIGCLGLIVVLFLCSRMLGGGDDTPKPAPADGPVATADGAEAEAPAVAMDTEAPAATEAPTDIPATDVPAEPIHLEGNGQTATDAIEIPFPVAVAAFTHNGSRNFAVKAIPDEGSEDLLVNEIGAYTGQVLLPTAAKIMFDIDADGAWTLDINPVGKADGPAFSGKGDAVSGIFDPPDSGPWEFSHDGASNFAVKAVCADRSRLVQNEIGKVSGSGVVQFGSGPCLWSVQADGNWSLAPRQ